MGAGMRTIHHQPPGKRKLTRKLSERFYWKISERTYVKARKMALLTGSRLLLETEGEAKEVHVQGVSGK